MGPTVRQLTSQQAIDLVALIQAHIGQPLVWGTRDFLTFIAAAINIILGRDISVGIKGQYANRLQLETFVQNHGGIVSIVTNFLGFAPGTVAGRDVGRGDVLLFRPYNRITLGFALDRQWAAVYADGGFVMAPVVDAIAVWRF